MPFSVKVSDPRCKFSSTHFLYHHSKCSRLHGHNYQMMVEIGGDLDEHFFVVDFFDIKSRLIELANELDHAVLIPTRSDNIHVTEKNNEVIVEMDNKKYVFPRGDVRLLPLKATTAELLARYIYFKLKADYGDYDIRVEISESEGSTAVYWE